MEADQVVGFALGAAFVAVVVVVLAEEVWFRVTGRRFLPHGPGPGDFAPGSCPDCGHLAAEGNPQPERVECRAEIESSGWGGDYCACGSPHHAVLASSE